MIDRTVTRAAAWLSKPVGFLATCGALAAGIGAALRWSEGYLLVFNLALSLLAIVLAGIILVAGAKDTSALHAKLDEIIRALDKADDRLIGIERAEAEEIEAARSALVRRFMRIQYDPSCHESSTWFA